MRTFSKPRIFISKCIEFEPCRYNGLKISSPVVRALIDHVDVVSHCPEVEIGLGIPRESLRLVQKDGSIELMQSKTERILTKKMRNYAKEILKKYTDIHGFILKSRSPSCGIKDVKLYPSLGKVPMLHSKAQGIFADEVLSMFSECPIEDEGRLTNFRLREHFFRRIFTLADFFSVKRMNNIKALTDFHARNKYLFMSYNQKELKHAGSIAANHDKLSIDEIIKLYEKSLNNILSALPRTSTNINVALHIFGYFSKHLTKKEKEYFLSEVDKYRQRQIPLSSVISILKTWVMRFENDYLEDQTYFEAFPEALLTIEDSGKGRLL